MIFCVFSKNRMNSLNTTRRGWLVFGTVTLIVSGTIFYVLNLQNSQKNVKFSQFNIYWFFLWYNNRDSERLQQPREYKIKNLKGLILTRRRVRIEFFVGPKTLVGIFILSAASRLNLRWKVYGTLDIMNEYGICRHELRSPSHNSPILAINVAWLKHYRNLWAIFESLVSAESRYVVIDWHVPDSPQPWLETTPSTPNLMCM